MQAAIPTIFKGATVMVRTSNGGEGIGRLLEDYRQTYDAVVDFYGNGRWTIIPSFRLQSIERVTEQRRNDALGSG